MTEALAPPKQKCRRCNGELSYDETRRCKFCPICHPPQKEKPKPAKEKPKYLDVSMTEEMVREIVRDELENWHIRKPPVTRDEIKSQVLEDLYPVVQTQSDAEQRQKEMTEAVGSAEEPVEIEQTWRQKAKGLGISLMKEPKGTGPRKKEDVLADIEAKQNEEISKELRTEEQAGSGGGQ